MSPGEDLLAVQLRALKLTGFQREYVFAAPRKWRADFAHVAARLLVEVEGGVWTQGRHSRGAGFVKDCEKYNAAAMEGWTLLRFTTDMVKTGAAAKLIEEFVTRRTKA
jgi:very-short-patch-repair endonuclease